MRLLKFEAPWCTKCDQMTKIMETMTFPFAIETVNVDRDRDTALEYGVRGIPHMILLDEHNNVVKRIGGVLNAEQLQEALVR